MPRLTILCAVLVLCGGSNVLAQSKKPKIKPNINKSQEFADVYHSPSADATPKVFRSILHLEVVQKKGDQEAQVLYANGVLVSNDGLVVSVVDAPGANQEKNGGIESASVLTLGGGGTAAELVAYEAAYGVAVFRVKGLEAKPFRLSQSSLVSNRRVSWHAIFRDGRKTYLYTRPLRIHKSAISAGKVDDLCEMIDHGSSSLNADRSGSAIVGLDGSLIALMGRQKHWNVSPKNKLPRTKVAWAVPAKLIAKIVAQTKS